MITPEDIELLEEVLDLLPHEHGPPVVTSNPNLPYVPYSERLISQAERIVHDQNVVRKFKELLQRFRTSDDIAANNAGLQQLRIINIGDKPGSEIPDPLIKDGDQSIASWEGEGGSRPDLQK
jgi:hypothetical protein